MICILLGSPGSGKGTQAKRLSAKYGLQHIATGDIFRAEIAKQTELGKKAQEYLKSGKLVPDKVVVEMVAGMIRPSGKYLLDGFPRTLDQAQGLTQILQGAGAAVDLVVYLRLAQSEALRRMTSRRVCSTCGEVYNTVYRQPKQNGICDLDGGKVVQREDDQDATAQKRLMVFEDLTQPLVAYYRGDQLLQEVDANQTPDAVEAELAKLIDAVGAKP